MVFPSMAGQNLRAGIQLPVTLFAFYAHIQRPVS